VALVLGLVTGLASGIAAFLFAAEKPKTGTQAGFAAVLGMLCLIQAGCALVDGIPALYGAIGTVVGLSLCFAKQGAPRAEPPGD
jgi:hypothetical protein